MRTCRKAQNRVSGRVSSHFFTFGIAAMRERCVKSVGYASDVNIWPKCSCGIASSKRSQRSIKLRSAYVSYAHQQSEQYLKVPFKFVYGSSLIISTMWTCVYSFEYPIWNPNKQAAHASGGTLSPQIFEILMFNRHKFL